MAIANNISIVDRNFSFRASNSKGLSKLKLEER